MGNTMKWDARRAGAMAGWLVVGVIGVQGAAHAAVAGNLALASDYVWRGSSQTGGEPAVQAGVRASAAGGGYASLWASNVAFEPDAGARSEFDAVVGWSGTLRPSWDLDVSVTRYIYPSTGRVLDWTEAAATVSWKQRAWLQLAHSADALGGGHDGTYLQLGARLPLTAGTRLEGAVGHYRLARAQGRDYTHLQLGVIHALVPGWELRATAHATSTAARTLFPGNAGSRLELALQGSF